MTVEQLLDAAEKLELSDVEKTAFNYLIEETEDNLPFYGLEGERLRNLCVAILTQKIKE